MAGISFAPRERSLMDFNIDPRVLLNSMDRQALKPIMSVKPTAQDVASYYGNIINSMAPKMVEPNKVTGSDIDNFYRDKIMKLMGSSRLDEPPVFVPPPKDPVNIDLPGWVPPEPNIDLPGLKLPEANNDLVNTQTEEILVDNQLVPNPLHPDNIAKEQQRAEYERKMREMKLTPEEQHAKEVRDWEKFRDATTGPIHVVPIEEGKKIDVPVNHPTDPDIISAINSSGGKITPEGIELDVTRYQHPNQVGQEALRDSIFYTIGKKSPYEKFYKTTNTNPGYGGNEKIEGRTIVKNPLIVKGASGGKVPERAYDEIFGKGSYEKVRKDSLAITFGGFNSGGANRNDKIDKIQSFLDIYVKESPLDAEYIYEHTKLGNQLPYALTELAVSTALRNKGYDSIIGYSKKRTGEPFMSEMVDLRENRYPGKQGQYWINSDFKNKEQ